MDNIVKQLEYLRNEIVMRDNQLILGLTVFAILTTASFIAAAASGKQLLYRLMIVLLISGIFYVGRQEYLEKRIAPWIIEAEQGVKSGEIPKSFRNWEEYLSKLDSRWFYLLPTDLFCGLAFYWMFCEAIRDMLKLKPWLTIEQFLQWSVVVTVFAVVWVFLGRWAANK